MNQPENVHPTHAHFVSDPTLYGRDPDDYCWPCSPEIAYIHRLEDRSNWLDLLGDCINMCPECPYSGILRDRTLGIGNMPLMAMRQRYLNQSIAMANLVEAAGHERPDFHPWTLDFQPEFWRIDDLPIQSRKRFSTRKNIDWQALKAQYDFRTEWELFYGPAVRRSRKSWTTDCPFHGGLSMALYEDGFHCFGCLEHGDVIHVLKASGRLAYAIERL